MKVQDAKIHFFKEDLDAYFHIIFLKYSVFFFFVCSPVICTSPAAAHWAPRHLKAGRNEHRSPSLSGRQPGAPPLRPGSLCTRCMRSLLQSLQIRDASLTHTAERLKTTISPFSYPRQPWVLTLSFLLKLRRFARSKAGLEGLCSNRTIFYRHTRLNWYRNLSMHASGYRSANSVPTRQNAACVGMHFWMDLSCEIWKKSKVCGKILTEGGMISDGAVL